MLPANLLNQSITYYPRTGLTDEGRPSFGSPVLYDARVQPINKTKTLALGQSQGQRLVGISARIIVANNPGFVVDDRIDYNGVKYQIQAVSVAIDGQGNEHHATYDCSKWNL